jgi:hypothetical protein
MTCRPAASAALAALSLLAFAATPSPSWGQAKVGHLVSGTVGITNLQDEGVGASVSAGYAIATRHVAVSLVVLDLGLFPKDDNAEVMVGPVFGDESRCRSRQTGQPVNNDLCDPRVLFAASAHVLAALPLSDRGSLGVGGGFRAGNSAGPYALAAIVIGPLNGRNWYLRGRFGEKLLVDLALGGSLPMHCLRTTGWRHCR